MNSHPHLVNSRDSHESQSRGLDSVRPCEWRDASGHPVTLYGSNERISDPERATERVGSIVRRLVSGRTSTRDGTPATVGLPTSGGVFLPGDISAQVIDLARDAMVINASGARTLPMATDELKLVRVTEDPAVAFIGETEEFPESGVTFGRLVLRARKMGCVVSISRELIEDAANAESEIERVLRNAMAHEFDKQALQGDGVGENVIGILNTDGVLTEDVSGALDYDSFLDGALQVSKENGDPRTVIMNATNANTLAKLKESNTGAYLQPPAMWPQLQRLATEAMPDDQCLIGDFRQVIIGLRSGVELQASAHPKFTSDQIVIRARWRGDVALAIPKHICRLHGITQ